METTIIAHVMCLALSSPELHLSEYRKSLSCQSLDHLIVEARKNDVDPVLLISVIFVESGWRRSAVSPAGACGLTQVIPKYTGNRLTGTKKYTCRQLKNPKNSITAGSKTLSFWINNYGRGNLKVGLCGYSSGFRCKGKRRLKAGFAYAEKVLRIKKKIDRIYRKKLSIYKEED
tara:strand:+ start:750 stop:1271 length:522 start_codon:yes stop_codon:yes gene_type:complete